MSELKETFEGPSISEKRAEPTIPASQSSPVIDSSPSAVREQDAFFQEFLRRARSDNLFESGARVLIAVSGGLDSTVLGHLLSRAQKLLGINVAFAHVNHGSRGQMSRQEGVWVRVLGEKLGVEVFTLELQDNIAKSQQEFRSLRRGLLIETAAKSGFNQIATAHHRDDNAETFLIRAIQGTGIYGLGAMAPKDRLWVRPLLWVGRTELENYARRYRLGWVEDPTNARGDYLRNKLRQEILPALDSIREGATRNLARLAERVQEEEKEWEEWISRQLETPYESLPRAWLEKWPEALQRRIFRVWLSKLGIEAEPALVEALIDGEEIIHERGSFLRRSDLYLFSAEKNFGQIWAQPLAVELSKRMSFGISTAWSFIPGAPEKFVPTEMAGFFLFRPPEGNWIGKPTIFSWDALPWPLKIRHRKKTDAHTALDKILARYRIPRPFWKSWPLVVSAQNDETIVALLGLEVLDAYRLKKLGRCVSMECFFGDRLKANLPS